MSSIITRFANFSNSQNILISSLGAGITYLIFHYGKKWSLLRAAVNANSSFTPSYLPVAVFVGGTAGIGQGMAEAFARHTNGNAHIIIIGRNGAAAESIISKFPKPTVPGAKHEFISCDAVLMKNVEDTTKDLLVRLPRINFLILSIGFVTKLSREDTEEGMDKKMAVFYYGRWKFVNDLIPLIRKAGDLGQAATVYSVLGAGKERKMDWANLGLKKKYSMMTLRQQTTAYTDIMFQEFSAQNPSLSFIHAYPGAVRTNLLKSVESILLRSFVNIMTVVSYPFTLSYVESGEYMLSAMLTIGRKPGAWRVDLDGKEIAKRPYVATEAERKRLWEHTVEEIASARAKA